MAISLSLTELASRVDGIILSGEASSLFCGIAALDSASAVEISFLGNEKYLPHFLATKAGAVIVPKGYDFGDHTSSLIAVENPSLAFGVVVKYFAKEARPFIPGIHPTAFVDPTVVLNKNQVQIGPGAKILSGAQIGDHTRIEANAVIYEDVKIGQECHIAANVTIRERCILGNRISIQPGAVIGSDGYGYEFSGGKHVKIDQVGIVELHDDVEIGANTSIDRARFGKTIVGEGTKIDNLCQIAHNVVIGKHCLIVSQSGIAGSSKIGDFVTVAAQVGVAGHVTVGDKATLVARCGVTTHLAGDLVYSGKPALPIREDNKLQSHLRRLPKLVARVKELEKLINKS